MHPISAQKQSDIASFLLQGVSIREVAKRCGISRSAVHRLRQNHESDIPKPRRSCPEKLAPHQKRLCIRSITAGKLGTATAVAKTLLEGDQVAVSRMTVSRCLHNTGLSSAEKWRSRCCR